MATLETDHKAAWQLYLRYQDELHAIVEANMRRLRVDVDSHVVSDIAHEACARYYKQRADKRPDEPLAYLAAIVRHLVYKKFCRSPQLSSQSCLNTALVPLADASDADLTPNPRDPMDDVALRLDLEAGISALENAKPEAARVFLGKAEGKTGQQLEEELGANRDRVNYLYRRARAFLRGIINHDKEQ